MTDVAEATAEKSVAESDTDSTPPAKPGPTHHYRLRAGALLAGGLFLVGFVFPWVHVGEVASVSGLELMLSDNIVIRNAIGPIQRWLIGLIPLTGVVLMVTGVRNVPGLRWTMIGSGLLLLVFGFVVVFSVFTQVTSYGLWLVIGGLLLALGVGGLVKR